MLRRKLTQRWLVARLILVKKSWSHEMAKLIFNNKCAVYAVRRNECLFGILKSVLMKRKFIDFGGIQRSYLPALLLIIF